MNFMLMIVLKVEMTWYVLDFDIITDFIMRSKYFRGKVFFERFMLVLNFENMYRYVSLVIQTVQFALCIVHEYINLAYGIDKMNYKSNQYFHAVGRMFDVQYV